MATCLPSFWRGGGDAVVAVAYQSRPRLEREIQPVGNYPYPVPCAVLMSKGTCPFDAVRVTVFFV